MPKYLFLLIFVIRFNPCSFGQSSNDSLISAAVHADSLFWNAYNQCDVRGMMQFVPHDIEFYHDKGGTTLGDSAFEASIKNGLCSDQGKFRLRREEAAGTTKANPMMKNDKVYGVLMTGKHLFYLSQNGEKEHAEGLAQYADLWLLQNGQWKMARVFSYDHQPPPQKNEKPVVPVAAATLKEYAGKYQGRKMGAMTVLNAKGYLTIIAGKMRLDVFPSSSTLFFAKERDLTFQFAKKEAGVIDVIVRENGVVVETYTAARK